MTSHVRHRRTTVPGGPPASNLEPGELALNLADGKLYTSSAASPAATSLLGVSIFQATAKYDVGDMVNHQNMIWIAKVAVDPAAFDQAQWTKISAADVANEVDDAMNTHLAAPDPHSQYATDTDLANHIGAADPHPGYATDIDLNALKTATDPFPQYTTDAEATAIATAAANAVKLAFTPVQQGGGTNQGANKVYIGWSASLGKLLAQVDGNDFAQVWPINADAALGVRHNGDKTQVLIKFAWSDPGGTPAYLWGGDGPASQFLVPPSRLRVANAANADAVNGISGWAYRNDANNPAYIWCTEGSGTAQHLTQPGNLSVNYANTSNYANRSGTCGTADNANAFGGQGTGYWINNAGSAVVNIRNQGAAIYLSGISGFGDVYWPVSLPSDIRLKQDIAPCAEDSLAKIMRLVFQQFRYKPMPWRSGKDDPSDHAKLFNVDDGRLHRVGLTADDAEQIDPDWVGTAGTYKQLDSSTLLMEALRAIQQLKREFDDYRAAHP